MTLIPLTLPGCGGGWTDSGSGVDICEDFPGRWEGTATSNTGRLEGIMSLQLKNDECNLTGAIVFQPCVPVTPVQGRTNIFGTFTVTALDGSIRVVQDHFNLSDDWNPNDSVESLFDPDIKTYEFRNTQGRPDCPATDAGTHQLRPVS